MKNQPSKPASRPATSAERTRYRVIVPVYREGREKPFWTRLGMAFENPPRNGSPPTISVKLDAAPLGRELVLFPDEPQANGEQAPEGFEEGSDAFE